MYVITGITGNVGGAAAQSLLSAHQSVRATVRNLDKARGWAERGVEVVAADFNDAIALEAAFRGAEGVFIMVPPYFAPEPEFPEARAIIDALRTALDKARPGKIVALSSIGAQQDNGLGLITQSHLLEEGLSSLSIPVAFVRAGWFMENSLWDVAPVQSTSVLSSFLSPLDRPFPMVATKDIGKVVAETLQQYWIGKRILELEGPRRYSQEDIAAVFASLLGKPVEAVAVPQEQWASFFANHGAAPHTLAPRIEMLNGFNSGWIDFEGGKAEHIIGQAPLEEVLSPALV